MAVKRGPRPYVRPALEELRDATAPPVRVRDLSALAGFSKKKIMADAKDRRVVLRWVKCGQRRMAVIDRPEAYRYLLTLGVECQSGRVE